MGESMQRAERLSKVFAFVLAGTVMLMMIYT